MAWPSRLWRKNPRSKRRPNHEFAPCDRPPSPGGSEPYEKSGSRRSRRRRIPALVSKCPARSRCLKHRDGGGNPSSVNLFMKRILTAVLAFLCLGAAASTVTNINFTDQYGNPLTTIIRLSSNLRLFNSPMGQIVVPNTQWLPIMPTNLTLPPGVWTATPSNSPQGLVFWTDATTNVYGFTNVVLTNLWYYGNANLGLSFNLYSTNQYLPGLGIIAVTNYVSGFPVISFAVALDTNVITTNASGLTLSGKFLGASFTVTNPAGNVSTLTISGSSGTGGQSVNLSSTPAGLTVGANITAPGFNSGSTIPGFTGDGSALTGVGPFSGDVTGTQGAMVINPKVTNNATAATATNFSGSLAGDVTGTQGATVVAKIGGIAAITAITNDANLRGVQTAQMSASGGGNELTDMFTWANLFDGQFGIAESGGGTSLWVSRGGPGTGTNVWGYPLDVLGGFDYIGNPFWYDIPKSGNLTSLQISWAYGPTASRLTSAYVGGNTNGPTIQPVLNLSDGNPFNGAGGFNITASFTNPALGSLIGTNADGIKIYKPPFGFQCIELGDAYNALRSATGNAGAEAQQAPGDIIILNGLPFYISVNGSRTGDTINGQIPLVNLDFRNPNDIRFRLPLQTANVWANTNANWLDSFYVDESTGAVAASNGQFTAKSLFSLAGGSITLTGPGGDGPGYGLIINSNASFNSLAGVASAWSFDGAASHRLGFWQKPGQYTKLAHGSGTPLILTMNTSGSDLLANQTGNQTDELTIDVNHNVIINAGQLTLNQTTNQPADTNHIKTWFVITNNGVAISVPGYK
jgi:hypothetical protein